MASISLNHIKKVYPGDIEVISDLNLQIKDKEFVVLVGPSGCGKSTTLRMIAGLEEISDGEMYIGDRKVNDVAPKDRDIAMVFQNYALYPHMSVEENMAGGLENFAAWASNKIAERVKEAARILELDGLLKRARVSYLAVSVSAWRWGVRLCVSRQCSCLMSRSLTSMPSCVCRCVLNCNSCTVA